MHEGMSKTEGAMKTSLTKAEIWLMFLKVFDII